MNFSSFRSSCLSDLFCSHSEVKLVAKIKSIAAKKEEGLDSRVGSTSGQGAGGQRLESRPGKLFFAPLKKHLSGLKPLNCLACRSRALLPTLFGLLDFAVLCI